MYTNKDIRSSVRRDVPSCNIQESLYDDFEIDRCVDWVCKNGVNKVCVQFPPDLLHLSVAVTHALEDKLHQKLYILGDTSYGSCCVDFVAAQHINADAVIHFGHACLSPTDNIPVLYIFPKKLIDVNSFCKCFKETFNSEDCVLLLYDVSYHHAINEISHCLKENFKQITISELISDEPNLIQTVYNLFGRVFSLPIDKNLKNIQVVFIGSDSACATNFKYLLPQILFYLYDPNVSSSLMIYDINIGKFLRQRMFLIEKIKEAKNIGILIGTLHVRNYLIAVQRIKSLTKPKGIKCYIISIGKPTVTKLSNFPQIDVYVMISCAENTLLNSKDYMQPIVTPYEVELAFNSAYDWSEKYIVDYNALLPGAEHYIEESSITTSETDISLISGNLRSFNCNNNIVSSELTIKEPGHVTLNDSRGANYLTTRSWIGLNPDLGQTDVHFASLGRSGTPAKYNNETS